MIHTPILSEFFPIRYFHMPEHSRSGPGDCLPTAFESDATPLSGDASHRTNSMSCSVVKIGARNNSRELLNSQESRQNSYDFCCNTSATTLVQPEVLRLSTCCQRNVSASFMKYPITNDELSFRDSCNRSHSFFLLSRLKLLLSSNQRVPLRTI